MLRKVLTKRNVLIALGVFVFLLVAVFSILAYLFFSYNPQRDRINLAFLGESGPGHAGSNLTDTMIFTSIYSKGTILVSVPRDFWYEPGKTKINAVYDYGQQDGGQGFAKTKEALGEIVGQKMDNAVLIDFQVFKDLVDLVGGVEINVDRTFDDFKYPIAGKEDDLCNGDKEYQCRYEHLHFDAGLQHMNGELALKYVRSRNAEGDEGTDTARSYRQEKVILALKKKLSSPNFFLYPSKLKQLNVILNNRVKSDMSRDDLIILARILVSSKARQLKTFVLDGWQEDNGLLYHPRRHSSGQWVLLPRDPSLDQIHKFIECLISQEDKSSCFPH